MSGGAWWSRCWWTAWWLVVAVGLGLAELRLSPVPALLALFLVSLCSAVVLGLLAASGRPATGHPVAASVRLGSAVLAFATITSESPAVALLLVLVATTSCPAVVRRCRAVGVRRTDTDTDTADTAVDGHPAGAGPTSLVEVVALVGRLTDEELGTLWRSTFWELHERHTDDERLTLVLLRQSCLDEIGRRDPAGLRSWLSSGGRASSVPHRFLHRPPSGGHDAA